MQKKKDEQSDKSIRNRGKKAENLSIYPKWHFAIGIIRSDLFFFCPGWEKVRQRQHGSSKTVRRNGKRSGPQKLDTGCEKGNGPKL